MTKATVRDKYKDLSREELIEKAYELGAGFEMYSNGCAQAVVAAIHEMVDIDDVVVKVSVPLCGGTARQLAGTCGALSGGFWYAVISSGVPRTSCRTRSMSSRMWMP